MRALILVLLVAAAGCATQPVPDSETTPVPRARIRHPAYMDAAPGTGTLSIKRDPGFVYSGCDVTLLLDAIPIADIAQGERTVLHIPPGDHVLSAIPSGRGLCKGGNIPEVAISLSAGESAAYRIAVTQGGLAIGPTAF